MKLALNDFFFIIFMSFLGVMLIVLILSLINSGVQNARERVLCDIYCDGKGLDSSYIDEESDMCVCQFCEIIDGGKFCKPSLYERVKVYLL